MASTSTSDPVQHFYEVCHSFLQLLFLPVVGRPFSTKKDFNSAIVTVAGDKWGHFPDSAMFAILNRTFIHHQSRDPNYCGQGA